MVCRIRRIQFDCVSSSIREHVFLLWFPYERKWNAHAQWYRDFVLQQFRNRTAHLTEWTNTESTRRTDCDIWNVFTNDCPMRLAEACTRFVVPFVPPPAPPTTAWWNGKFHQLFWYDLRYPNNIWVKVTIAQYNNNSNSTQLNMCAALVYIARDSYLSRWIWWLYRSFCVLNDADNNNNTHTHAHRIIKCRRYLLSHVNTCNIVCAWVVLRLSTRSSAFGLYCIHISQNQKTMNDKAGDERRKEEDSWWMRGSGSGG